MSERTWAGARRWLGNLSLALASLAVLAGLAEGTARVAGVRPQRETGPLLGWASATEDVWRFEPGSEWRTFVGGHQARANSMGFRERELGPKRPGGFRILVLGDSVTFGHGQPAGAAFTRQLETRLALGRPALQVLNAGIPGWSTYQQRRFYERDGEALEPDLVLVAFVLNDAVEIELGVEKLRLRAGFGFARAFNRLASWSAALSYLKRSYLDAFDPHGRPLQSVVQLAGAPESPEARRAMTNVAAELDALHDLATRRGDRFGLLLFPFRFQLADPSLDGPQRFLVEFARERGIPVLDLLPVLEPRGARLVLMDADHLTRRGHELVAEAIARWLEDERLLPQQEPPA